MADYDRGLEPLVKRAISDLAERLGVTEDEISVVSAVLCSWPNAGLGRDDGMRHPAVPVDGSEIVLRCRGATYSYRTGGRVYHPILVT